MLSLGEGAVLEHLLVNILMVYINMKQGGM